MFTNTRGLLVRDLKPRLAHNDYLTEKKIIFIMEKKNAVLRVYLSWEWGEVNL
jgi:hypothetical protein